ncbi:hypothetical protein [Nonomuraea cypriaca]|nr:hypothetical protein [Nonomuraea cypriaca]
MALGAGTFVGAPVTDLPDHRCAPHEEPIDCDSHWTGNPKNGGSV